MGIGRRSLEVLRAEGPRGLWWRGLGVTVYRRLILVARRLESPPRVAAKIVADAELLEEGTVDDYVALRPDTTAAEVERRLRTGQRCLLVRHQGVPVSTLWFATLRAEFPYLELVFDLPDGVGYVYDVHTAPDARGLGIWATVRPYHEGILREEGCHTLLGTAMPENVSGRGLVGGAGYASVGMIGCLRLGGLRLPVRRCRAGCLGAAHRLRT